MKNKIKHQMEALTAAEHNFLGRAFVQSIIKESETLCELGGSGITPEEQNQVRAFIVKRAGCDDTRIDGSGCESGDPIDLTLDEIGQGFNYLFDEVVDPLKLEVERLRAELDIANKIKGGEL